MIRLKIYIRKLKDQIKRRRKIWLNSLKSLGISRNPIKKLLEGKEAAFLSKKLATIKTDITSIQKLDLNDLTLDINKELLKQRLSSLDIKTLL